MTIYDLGPLRGCVSHLLFVSLQRDALESCSYIGQSADQVYITAPCLSC